MSFSVCDLHNVDIFGWYVFGAILLWTINSQWPMVTTVNISGLSDLDYFAALNLPEMKLVRHYLEIM